MSRSSFITHKQIADIQHIIQKEAIPVPLVAVYCGSHSGHQTLYTQTAKLLGKNLVQSGFGLVYGGASVGMMGTIADSVLEEGGYAVGVIPEFILGREAAHERLTRLHFTDTMHTRKTIMAEYASAFITLPGGFGTLDEIMEIATWRQLNLHQKPMIILNINGFYDHMLAHLQVAVEEGFMNPKDFNHLTICQTVDETIEYLTNVHGL